MQTRHRNSTSQTGTNSQPELFGTFVGHPIASPVNHRHTTHVKKGSPVAIQPGHYPKLSNEDYHADPSISKTKLDVIAAPDGCPRRYWETFVRDDRDAREVTKAMIIGSALHAAVLEPDLFSDRYVAFLEKVDRRYVEGKKAYAQFTAANLGKIILDADDWNSVIGMRDAVHAHPEARPYFARVRCEESFFARDPETGLMIRCKPDAFDDQANVADLKSTEDASAEGFGRSAATWRYDVQAGFYPYVMRLSPPQMVVRSFTFVAVEKKKPHAIGIYYTTPDQFAPALEEARANLRAIGDGLRNGHWPDFAEAEGPQPLNLPFWYTRRRGNK